MSRITVGMRRLWRWVGDPEDSMLNRGGAASGDGDQQEGIWEREGEHDTRHCVLDKCKATRRSLTVHVTKIGNGKGIGQALGPRRAIEAVLGMEGQRASASCFAPQERRQTEQHLASSVHSYACTHELHDTVL